MKNAENITIHNGQIWFPDRDGATSGPHDDMTAAYHAASVFAGCYPENDGGDWYVVIAGGKGRIAEDFVTLKSAQLFVIMLAMGKPTEGCTCERTDRALYAELYMPDGYRATVWMRECRKYFPHLAKHFQL